MTSVNVSNYDSKNKKSMCDFLIKATNGLSKLSQVFEHQPKEATFARGMMLWCTKKLALLFTCLAAR